MTIRDLGLSNDPLKLWPSLPSERRWVALYVRLGYYRPCRRNGNVHANVLRDHNLLLLVLYRIVFPKAKIAEINAFLYRANYGNIDFRFYSPSQISEAEKRMGLTAKRGSTTAYQALLPINRQKRWIYWNMPYPFGIANIRRRDIFDLDECGVFVETASRGIGKSYIGLRVGQAGPYSKGEKWNLLLGISGDENGHRWRDIWLEGGTTYEKMINFIATILNDIGPGTPERRRCFTMDNLNSHHCTQVSAMIYAAGHRLVFRAPYYPVDGPIEYVFNTLQAYLRINMYRITNGETLVHEILNGITSMDKQYFIFCGFWRE